MNVNKPPNKGGIKDASGVEWDEILALVVLFMVTVGVVMMIPYMGATSDYEPIGVAVAEEEWPQVDWSPLTEASADVNTVRFSYDDSYIVYGSNDDGVYLHNADDGSFIRDLASGISSSNVRGMDVSPDEHKLIYGTDDQNAYIVDFDGSLLHTLTRSSGTVWDVAWGDGLVAYSGHDGDWNGRVYVDNATDGSAEWTVALSDTDQIRAVEFSPDGSQIAYGDNDNIVFVHDASDGSFIRELTEAEGSIRDIAYSPDSSEIAYGSVDNKVHIHNTETGDHIRSLDDASYIIQGVRYSPDGSQIAGASADGNTYIWDAETGDLIKVLDDGGGGLSVDYTNDGQLLAHSSSDNNVYIHDTIDIIVTAGNTLEVTSDITNVGFIEDTRDVWLERNPEGVPDVTEEDRHEDLTLEVSETEVGLVLTWETEAGDEGRWTVTVRTPHDADARTVKVEEA